MTTLSPPPPTTPLSALGDGASFKDWQQAIRSVRMLHLQGEHTRCASTCTDLLLRDDIRPVHASALHFYRALSHEVIAEPLAAHGQRDELDPKLHHLETATRNFDMALRMLPGPNKSPPTTPNERVDSPQSRKSPPTLMTPPSAGRRSAIPRPLNVSPPGGAIIIVTHEAPSSDELDGTAAIKNGEERLSISQFPTPPTFVRPRPGKAPRLDFSPRPALNRRKRPAALMPKLGHVRETPSEDAHTLRRLERPVSPPPGEGEGAGPVPHLTPSADTILAWSPTRDYLQTPRPWLKSPNSATFGDSPSPLSPMSPDGQIDARLMKQMQALEPILQAHKKHTEKLVLETRACIAALDTARHDDELESLCSLDSGRQLSTITTQSLESLRTDRTTTTGSAFSMSGMSLPDQANFNEPKTISARIAEGRSRGWQRPRYDPTRTRQLCSSVLAELNVHSA